MLEKQFGSKYFWKNVICFAAILEPLLHTLGFITTELGSILCKNCS